MNFEDLKEQFMSTVKNRWEQFQDSSLYNQAKDRFENLSPVMQKLTLVGVAALVLYIILSIPLGYISTSNERVAEFETNRQLIRDLLKVSREVQDVPNIQPAPPMEVIQSRISQEIQNARLLPEQVKDSSVVTDTSELIPQNLSQGTVKISLAKLNLRQVLDLGFQFQNINPSVKLKDVAVVANAEDARYFDVTYKLAALAVPDLSETPDAPETPGPRAGRK